MAAPILVTSISLLRLKFLAALGSASERAR